MLARELRSQLNFQPPNPFVKYAEPQVEDGALAAALETNDAGSGAVLGSVVVNQARGSEDPCINDAAIARAMSTVSEEGDYDSGDETSSESYDEKKVLN